MGSRRKENHRRNEAILSESRSDQGFLNPQRNKEVQYEIQKIVVLLRDRLRRSETAGVQKGKRVWHWHMRRSGGRRRNGAHASVGASRHRGFIRLRGMACV